MHVRIPFGHTGIGFRLSRLGGFFYTCKSMFPELAGKPYKVSGDRTGPCISDTVHKMSRDACICGVVMLRLSYSGDAIRVRYIE
jgi:hypothetical protein